MKSYVFRYLVVMCLLGIFFSCSKPQQIVRYGDMLPRSNPENQGVATEGILRFLEEVELNEIELHSFMMLRHGKVIAEAWWHPYKPDINHIMHSVSKTFTSTAIGFAVNEKKLKVTDKVISFFPDDIPSTVSSYLSELTVKDLLTMTAGHETAPVFFIDDTNWVRSFLAAPIVNEPGTQFQYSSYASYMLSAIITQITGESVLDYLKPRLIDPLGINDIQWEEGNKGISAGGWGLRMKTVDMAKLGLFYLNKGVWNKKRLLPASWIEEATSPHIYQRPDRTPAENAEDEGAQGYGYQIWMSTHDSYRADGAYGQYVLVMPDKDVVIAITARVEATHQIFELIWDHIYPSILNRMIKSDEAAWDDLISMKAGLQIRNPFQTPEGTPLLTDTVLSYQIETNELQVENVSFRFDDQAQCFMELKIKGATYTFPFGEDNWLYGETQRPSPYFLNPRRNPEGLAPFSIAGYSSWEQTDYLKLCLYYITDIQHEIFACRFAGDQITVEWTNSASPNEPPVIFTGRKT